MVDVISTTHFRLFMFPTGFEPTTFRLGGGRSIQLSYGNKCRFLAYLQAFSTFLPSATGNR